MLREVSKYPSTHFREALVEAKNWGVYTNGHTASIIPHNDLIEHTDEDCTCGPRTEPVEVDDGSINWIHVHHSLDGRELQEAK